MGKYKIIVQKSNQPSSEGRYVSTESIYEQSTDNEIDLMGVIQAFNKEVTPTVSKNGHE